MFYSKATGGFYSKELHGENLPVGSVEITDDYYRSLLKGQESGDRIVSGMDGCPMLVTPEPAKVQSVTMRQARLALLAAGKLSAVNAAIAAMPGELGEAARIEWEFASDVRKDSPLIAGLAASLGLSPGELDALFESAVSR